MATANPRLADLSDGERRMLESWLVEFNQQWDEGLLARRAGRIPPGSSWRLPALAEMVKIDLQRHWQHGQSISLESYLADYPELGRPGDASVELILAEYEVRRQFGAAADLEEYARRFPRQAEALRRRVARGDSAFSGRPWAAGRASAAGIADPPSPPRAAAEAARPLPEQLGRYRIIRRLGQGGMGSVYLAEDTRLKRPVALKIPTFGLTDGAEALERFDREAAAAATLDHPYLCPVYDVGEADGVHYLAMAYIEGHSLADTIQGAGQPPRQVAALVGKLAVAMQEAHARGVIHRDLKPSNIMIKATGRRREPVIVDFGLAHRQDMQEVRVTKTGQVLGTLAYMAPEQLRGDPRAVGPACDIYALGVILYELLTGRLPFDGTGLAVVGQILTQPPPLSEVRPDLDARLEAICLKAMAKEPKDRYATMGELAAALTDYLRAAAFAPTSQVSPPRGPSAGPAGNGPRPTGSDTLVAQLLDRVAAEQAAIPILDPQPRPGVAGRWAFAARRPPWPVLAAAAGLFGVVLLGVIIYVATDQGRIKIRIDDPKAVVRIDGDEVRIEDLGAPITLRAGEHSLTVQWGDGAFQTSRFEIKRGLLVQYQPKGGGPAAAKPGPVPVLDPGPAAPIAAGVSTSIPVEASSSHGSITNSIGMKLVPIPAGEFLMGSPDPVLRIPEVSPNENPRHRVRITRPFYLAIHEVTQGQYRAVSGANPSYYKGSDDLPVEQVRWYNAVAFCNALSVKERLKPYYRIVETAVPIQRGSGDPLTPARPPIIPSDPLW